MSAPDRPLIAGKIGSLFPRLGTEELLLGLLLLLFCARIWSFGITNTDDAYWAVFARQPDAHPVRDFVEFQGRFWGLGAGTWVLYALRWQGTLWGDLLATVPFALYFVLFYRCVSLYWSRKTALLAACLFFGLFALRWDRSVLTAYPLFMWLPGSALLGAILLARGYQTGRGAARLPLSLALFILSLFNNEGEIVVSALLFFAALPANFVQGKGIPVSPAAFRADPRSWRLFSWAAGLCLLYGGIALAWRFHFGSGYAGTVLAKFNPAHIAEALFNFTCSDTTLHSLFVPYSVNYVDAITASNAIVFYKPLYYFPSILTHPEALATGGIVGFVTGRLLAGEGSRESAAARPVSWWPALGLAIAALPLLPVAMTQQYQGWLFSYNARAYSHSVVALFGLSLAAAGLVQGLLGLAAGRRAARLGMVLALAAGLGALAALGTRMNDAIADDMRPETARWRLLSDIVQIARATDAREDTFWAPRFRSGTWFGVVPSSYWGQYADLRYHFPLRFEDARDFRSSDPAHPVQYVDYTANPDRRSFTLFAARYAPGSGPGTPEPAVDRIAVVVEKDIPAESAGRFLVFLDRRAGWRQIRLRDLPRLSRTVRIIEGLQADPSTIGIYPEGRLLPRAGEAAKP